ncbi:MAG TPA: KH domain-containing protein [Candidatus Krumholzibacteria bacterium]|nr:KH domain-containing protein [Candidatus Krumholzibacteria bacterium]HRX50292.1 KH domain-containing protein [Candidatus Krumholzibacteria bacterium]
MASALDLVSWVVVNLVDHPDDVRIRRLERDGGEIFEVHVHADDLGQVIGKGGQTAKSLRTLLEAMGKRSGRTFGLEIADEDAVAAEAAAPAADETSA